MRTSTFIRSFLLLLMLLVTGNIFAEKKVKQQDELELVKPITDNSLTKNPTSGENPIRSDVSIDVSKDFALTASLKLQPKETKKWSFVLNGKLGSTNKYTPLLDKGKWAISTKLGMTVNFTFGAKGEFLNEDVEAEIQSINATEGTALSIYSQTDKQTVIQRMKPEQKNKFRIYWLSMDAKYTFNEYILLKDSISVVMDELTTSSRKSGFDLTLQINGLKVLNAKKGMQFSWAAGYVLGINNNNYEKLKEVKLQHISTLSDSLGNSIIISSDESRVRKGVLAFSTGHTFFADLHFTISNQKSGKVAVDFFAKPECSVNKSSKILNLSTGINFGVVKDANDKNKAKSVVNVGVAVNFEDLTRKFEGGQDYKNRIVPAIIVGVPLPEIGKS